MNASPWTPEQQQWLQAMGHAVWQMATPGAAVEASTGDGDARQEAARLLHRDERPQQRAAPPPRAVAPDRLMQAVLRAARRPPGDADVAVLLPDATDLRGNAAAKRALWPRLRALRRTERGT